MPAQQVFCGSVFTEKVPLSPLCRTFGFSTIFAGMLGFVHVLVTVNPRPKIQAIAIVLNRENARDTMT